MSYTIAEGTSHRQPWHVLVLQPHSEGTQRIAVLVSVRIYSAPVIYYSLRLILVIRFVVAG